jgi:hypothetical protein
VPKLESKRLARKKKRFIPYAVECRGLPLLN